MDFHLCLLFHFKKGGNVVIVQGVPKVRSSNFIHYNLLIKTLFLLEIARRCLFHYREHVFRISVTGVPFLFFLSHSVAVTA